MWAQDAAAMYGYAGSSALATELTRFVDPPNTTTAGAASESAAVAQATAAPAGNSAQTVASAVTRAGRGGAAGAAPAVGGSVAGGHQPLQHGLVWNTIEDF